MVLVRAAEMPPTGGPPGTPPQGSDGTRAWGRGAHGPRRTEGKPPACSSVGHTGAPGLRGPRLGFLWTCTCALRTVPQARKMPCVGIHGPAQPQQSLTLRRGLAGEGGTHELCVQGSCAAQPPTPRHRPARGQDSLHRLPHFKSPGRGLPAPAAPAGWALRAPAPGVHLASFALQKPRSPRRSPRRSPHRPMALPSSPPRWRPQPGSQPCRTSYSRTRCHAAAQICSPGGRPTEGAPRPRAAWPPCPPVSGERAHAISRIASLWRGHWRWQRPAPRHPARRRACPRLRERLGSPRVPLGKPEIMAPDGLAGLTAAESGTSSEVPKVPEYPLSAQTPGEPVLGVRAGRSHAGSFPRDLRLAGGGSHVARAVTVSPTSPPGCAGARNRPGVLFSLGMTSKVNCQELKQFLRILFRIQELYYRK